MKLAILLIVVFWLGGCVCETKYLLQTYYTIPLEKRANAPLYQKIILFFGIFVRSLQWFYVDYYYKEENK
jgi:hypothetical protein